jgi:hypothetical protein
MSVSQISETTAKEDIMIELAYGLYLLISIALTIWVARTLSTNGEVFLVQCFGHNAELAKSTNHLLVVGFYPSTSVSSR